MSTLYLVATPIGNLADISRRALDVLGQADLIAAEDTRVSRRLLDHYGIGGALVTYTDAYERQKADRQRLLLAALDEGRTVALVCDAGMPGLADPGFELVAAAVTAGHEVVAIPGPSAIVTALAASGLPTDRFTFVGFLPRKRAARRAFIAALADEPGTLVAFESPRRLQGALDDMLEILGDRPVAVARELTKLHEQIWRGSLAAAVAAFAGEPARGEITLVVAGTGRQRDGDRWSLAQVRQAIALLRAEGLAPAAIARVVARLSGWSRGEIYDLQNADAA